MLQHFGITAQQIFTVERLQPHRVNNNRFSLAEHPYFVLQTTEVNACLAAHTRINHSQQRGGHIDEADATLKRSSRKATKVGYHSTAKVDEQRVARGILCLQGRPNVGERSKVFVGVGTRNDNQPCTFKAVEVFYSVVTHTGSGVVGKDKHLVGIAFYNGFGKTLLELMSKNNLLLHSFFLF